MKKLLILIPVLLFVGCAGHVSLNTQMPADTDLEIVIKSSKHES
jgi:hypothetical protein